MSHLNKTIELYENAINQIIREIEDTQHTNMCAIRKKCRLVFLRALLKSHSTKKGELCYLAE